ncbi:MFS transporter [Cellulomonas sp. IC4_254]|uniref:MFS transporter n=1 Tax=Cellulomonas sp. IC4_254 TaxID=2714040 RepID=UPI00141E32E5|nr:MFS transporter [Cellulomonas sp. IC4_254]NHT16119.1 MFS transporter [Cellulomonas sp. IC4_254]
MSIAAVDKAPTAKVWNSAFINIFLAYFLVNVALGMSNNLSTPFAKELGATPVLIGVVATGFTYGAIVFKLASAPAIDTYNRKFVLLGAVAVIAIAFVGYAISTTVPVLITFRVLQGVGQAFTATTFIALAADTLPREKLAQGMGTFAIGTAAATMVAAPIALKVQEATSYRATFVIALVVLVLGAVAILRIELRPLPRKKFRITLNGFIAVEAIPPALMQFLFMMAWSCVFSFLIVFGMDQGLGSNVGFFNTAYGLAVFVAAPLGGRLVDRFGYYMLIPMMVFMGVALLLISISTNLVTLLVAAVCGAFGYGAAGPVVRSMAMGIVPKPRRGAASSTLFLASDVGQLLGPIVGGILATSFGYAAMFRVVPGYLLLVVVLLLVTRRSLTSRIASVAAAEQAEVEAAARAA